MQTLTSYLEQQALPQTLQQLLSQLAKTSISISHTVRSGALIDVLGTTQQENVQGETQKIRYHHQ